MNPADMPKTAIIILFGLFVFKYMTFGLKNAAQTFQRLMDSLFHIYHFMFIYVANIPVFSHNRPQHLNHLSQVFDVLAKNGLCLNPAKCTFIVPEVDCLGHHVTLTAFNHSPPKFKPILSFPPADLSALHRFLGMLNYYRRFLPGIAYVLQPHSPMLFPYSPFLWTPAMQTMQMPNPF